MIHEIRWLYASGSTSIYLIVDRSYLSSDSGAEWAAADAMTDLTFQTTLTKIVLIGRYFFH